MRHALKSQRVPELCCALNPRVQRQKVDELETMLHQRRCQGTADAALSPCRTNVKAPQPERAHALIGFQRQATDGDERLVLESREQQFTRLVEPFDATLPVGLQTREISYTLEIRVAAQRGKSRRQAIRHTFEAQRVSAQIFTRYTRAAVPLNKAVFSADE
jgi:hypothetical protein